MTIKTYAIFLALNIPFFCATVWAVVNAGTKDFGSMRKKLLWVLVAAIPYIGFIIYLLFGFRKGRRPPIPVDNAPEIR